MLAPNAAAARALGREARFASSWRRLLSSREAGKSGALSLRAGMEEVEEAAFAEKYVSWEGMGVGGDTPPPDDTPFGGGGGCGGGR